MIFKRGKHRGQKASNYSGGAPEYHGKHVATNDYAHNNKLCGCPLCPDSHPGRHHCADHDNGCHWSC